LVIVFNYTELIDNLVVAFSVTIVAMSERMSIPSRLHVLFKYSQLSPPIGLQLSAH